MLFDSHAHYDNEKFDGDRYEVISNVREKGVNYILNAASDIPSSLKCIDLSAKFDFVYAAVGIHPHSVANAGEDVVLTLSEFAGNEKVVAIGEIGLDYYYDTSPKDIQNAMFRKQLSLARDLGLPVIVHDRDAHEDTMKAIKEFPGVKGVIHCFSGSVEMAKILLEMGFYISFGGPVTFKNAVRPGEVAKYVPIDRLLVETDCPYLTPFPYRGQRNDSGYLGIIVEKIAELRGITYEEVAEATFKNAVTLFKILGSI